MRLTSWILLAACVASASAAPAQDLRAAIDSFVSRQVAADQFSGVVAVARNGSVAYQRAVGVTPDTKLQIGSTTKLFTNIAIRQLEQAGKLALSDTVGRFLPDYPNETVRRKVTVEQLLRHRSGIGSFWNDRWIATHASVRTIRDYLDLFARDSLLFAPGTSEAYSNGGYVVLGAIIEKLSGQSYHDYLHDHVFRPAGMANTVPFDRRAPAANAAVGYTRQGAMTAPSGADQRMAGTGPRPGYDTARAPAAAAQGERRMRIMGADGKELSPSEAEAAIARRAAESTPRRSNLDIQPGLSGPAGDHYSTAGDFLKLAAALSSHKLLDARHTAALLGASYAAGSDFRSNGGGPGVNAEFSMYPSGDVMIVLSNYDPPSATTIAQFIRGLLHPAAAPAPSKEPSVREEIENLHARMIAAFKASPASVADFYTDDARIIGMGAEANGKEQVKAYWTRSPGGAEWTLDVMEVGGTRDAPWILGRSTLASSEGRRMVASYVAILERGADGKLRYKIDLYTPAAPATAPATPVVRGPDQVTFAGTRAEIPLTRRGGFYYADVKVNGKPFRFTLETGANFVFIGNRVARELGFPTDTTQPVNGRVMMQPGAQQPQNVRIDSLSAAGVTFKGFDARVVGMFDGSDFDGIISLPLLQDLLWTMDLANSRLVVERGSLPTPNGRDIVAMARRDAGGRLDFNMTLGGEEQPAVIDTRYADWIMTNDSLLPKMKLSSPVRTVGTARGPTLGTFQMRGGRLDGDVHFGRYSFPRAPVVFRDRGGTIVGVNFLEQFAVTVDQRNGRMRFTRADSTVVVPSLPWESTATPARSFGFRMAARPGGRLYVVMLDTTSAAAKAGIRENDEVVEFDGVAATDMSPEVFRAALARGGATRIVILRDGKRMQLMIESR